MPRDFPRSPEEAADFVNSATALWRNRLILGDKKAPKALLANAIIALRAAPEWAGILAYDAFHQRTVLRGRAPWMDDAVEQPWTGGDDVLVADWLQHERISVPPHVAGQAIEAVARERRFHPVLEYLARCVWDGEHRLDEWAVRYLGAPDTPYVRAVSARFMIGAVARVTEPGCKADCALILEGRQGLGKSSALRVLAMPWFTDEIGDLGTKDAAMQLAGVWVIELAELDSIARGDVSRIKSFMSRTIDRFRPPYGRRVVEQPRQCVFAGTVNHNEYLRDETGGRRFWPIACSRIDVNGLAAVRDQLWGEARDRYLAGGIWWLNSQELNQEAALEQRERYQPDSWEARIEKYIAGLNSATVPEILENALSLPVADWSQIAQNRVAQCLRAIGWERRQGRVGVRREWRYHRPAPVPSIGEHDR